MPTQRISQWLAIRCKEPLFWRFLSVSGEPEAVHRVREICRIKSRRELDTDLEAAQRFHTAIRLPFIEYNESSRKMKLSLCYDTETTGLPNWNLPSNDPSQPRVMALAAQLFNDETGEVVDSMDVLIKPDGWEIPDLIVNLTGITNEMCEATGVAMEIALTQFLNMWTQADQRVAHNESFDMRMLRIEIMRHPYYSMQVVGEEPFADYWKKAPAYCTAGNSVKVINLPPTEKMIRAGRRTPKTPSMAEAYFFYTGKVLQNAHSARADMEACKEVYFGIRSGRTTAAPVVAIETQADQLAA